MTFFTVLCRGLALEFNMTTGSSRLSEAAKPDTGHESGFQTRLLELKEEGLTMVVQPVS